MNDFFSTKEAASSAGVSLVLACKWAAKNNVQCAGVGKGSIYFWTAEDVERFKARGTKRGRPRKD